MTKVLLINPNSKFKTPVLQLGLVYLASYLKKHQVKVSVIDAWAENLSSEELKERVDQIQADLIGLYMLSPLYEEAKTVIKICRQNFPDKLIVAGGPHPSAMPVSTLEEIPELDICVVGEGENTLLELIKAVEKDSGFSKIKGVVFRSKAQKIITTKPRGYIKNLDNLPFPALELFPLEKYKTHPPYGRYNPYFPMVTSRGCPFQCAYCPKEVFKNNYRAHSSQRVCDEIQGLIAKYGVREIHFYDDDFTLDMKRAEEICDEIIKRKLNFTWSCTTRVDLINENLLKKMKGAGCWLISYGAESGSQKILDSIKKGINRFELMRCSV